MNLVLILIKVLHLSDPTTRTAVLLFTPASMFKGQSKYAFKENDYLKTTGYIIAKVQQYQDQSTIDDCKAVSWQLEHMKQ